MSQIRKCVCCGNEYKYCPNCNNDSQFPKWMVSYDTEACKELFNVVSGYNMKVSDANAVKAVINKYSITDFSKYSDGVAKVLREVSKNNNAQPAKNDNNNFFKKSKQNKNMDVELKEEAKEEVVDPVKADSDKEASLD